MSEARTTADTEGRLRLIADPGGKDACADHIRALTDSRSVFRWFRRLATLTTEPDGDVLRQAIEATRAIDGRALRRFANSGVFVDRLIVPFVAAAVMANARLDLGKIAATPYRFGDMKDNFERAVALLSERTVPATARETFEIMLVKQYIGAVLSDAGYLDLGAQVSRNVSGFMRAMRKTLYGESFRGVTDHWTFAIGHMVVLAYLIKGQAAGVFDFNGIKVWEGKVANSFLWEQMTTLSPNVEVVPSGSVFADNHSSGNLEWVDGRFVDHFEACRIVADRAGDARGAILARPDPSHPALARFYATVGFKPGDRIVTVHCREAGYRVNQRHDLRNADVAAYVPAIAALVARGYRVVRLGDGSMTPLPAMDGVVDYAVSALKSAELDVLLPAVARFHIGSSSGLSLVPLLYATPCLFLNWYPFDLLPWGRQNWTVVKPVVALADRRRVVDRPTYATLARMRERRLLNSFGYDARDLGADEVGRAVAGFAEAVEAERPAPAKNGPNLSCVLVADDQGLLRSLA